MDSVLWTSCKVNRNIFMLFELGHLHYSTADPEGAPSPNGTQVFRFRQKAPAWKIGALQREILDLRIEKSHTILREAMMVG